MRFARRASGVVAVAAVLFGLGAIGPGGGAADQPPSTTPARAEPIAALEQKVAAGGAGARDLAALALGYLDKVHAEADPTLIPTARDLIEGSFSAQQKGNFEALVASASLANVTHDFSGAVKWSRRAIAVNPHNAAPYGLLGDSLFELGRYNGSEAAYQEMVDTKPNVASYVRASYAAQSHGNYSAALHALRLALQATSPVGETAAYLHHQIGDVFYAQRHFLRSQRENQTGMRAAPGYTPPTVGLAEALVARGELKAALPIMQKAVKEVPSIEYYATLGDIHRSLGQHSEARNVYAEAAERLRIYRRSGVRPDVDFILFYADHGLRPAAALREARAIYANRPTAPAADALGWMLHTVGRDREAARFAGLALRHARVPDATFEFHADSIAAALGRVEDAIAHLERAFHLDPLFSPFHRDHATALLRRLESRAGGSS